MCARAVFRFTSGFTRLLIEREIKSEIEAEIKASIHQHQQFQVLKLSLYHRKRVHIEIEIHNREFVVFSRSEFRFTFEFRYLSARIDGKKGSITNALLSTSIKCRKRRVSFALEEAFAKRKLNKPHFSHSKLFFGRVWKAEEERKRKKIDGRNGRRGCDTIVEGTICAG